jgi:hypothetical protein
LIGLDSLFQKTPMFKPKKRTVKPRDAFENAAFEQWFENVRGCREAALHLIVKQISSTDSWRRVDSDRYNFHPLMPTLTLVSLLERYLVLETAMLSLHAAWRHRKTTVCTSIVYDLSRHRVQQP